MSDVQWKWDHQTPSVLVFSCNNMVQEFYSQFFFLFRRQNTEKEVQAEINNNATRLPGTVLGSNGHLSSGKHGIALYFCSLL